MFILLGYTNWSEGSEETIIGPYTLSSPITQVVMTAGKMATGHPLQPARDVRYLKELCRFSSVPLAGQGL